MTLDLFQLIRREGPGVVLVLDDVPDINVRNEDGESLLHAAVAYGNKSAIDELIRLGIDVNARDSKGQTPLHFAGAYQDAAAAETILKSGGDFSSVDSHGNSPLWSALLNAKGKYEVVEVLVRNGAIDVAGMKNRYGRSPLDFASQIGDERLIELLTGR